MTSTQDITLDGDVIDLFAGPGGWSLALDALGLASREVGVEWDPAACQTRAAAGWRTIRADVAAMDLTRFVGRVWGLIASPPCQLFSRAGDQDGILAIDVLIRALGPLLDGEDPRDEVRAAVRTLIRPAEEAANAERRRPLDADALTKRITGKAYNAALVLEPARWIAATEPRWVALEQVPAVLPIWQALARLLRDRGYSAWCGIVNAADLGVAQTRTRAILVATLDGVAHPPAPTHAEGGEATLFGSLAPWVSMAEALGWVVPPDAAIATGTNSATVTVGQRSGDWRVESEPYERPVTRPAPTVIANAGKWRLVPGGTGYRGDPHRRPYDIDGPAPTIAFGKDYTGWRWVLNTGRDWKPGGTRDDAQTIELDQPAPTVAGVPGQWHWRQRRNDQSTAVSDGEVDVDWPEHRPATTIATRGLVPDPGANANRFNGAAKSRNDGITVTVVEAGILQSFPPDYPWQGSRAKQYEQAGNAIPPLMAFHVLATLLGVDPATALEVAAHA